MSCSLTLRPAKGTHHPTYPRSMVRGTERDTRSVAEIPPNRAAGAPVACCQPATTAPSRGRRSPIVQVNSLPSTAQMPFPFCRSSSLEIICFFFLKQTNKTLSLVIKQLNRSVGRGADVTLEFTAFSGQRLRVPTRFRRRAAARQAGQGAGRARALNSGERRGRGKVNQPSGSGSYLSDRISPDCAPV